MRPGDISILSCISRTLKQSLLHSSRTRPLSASCGVILALSCYCQGVSTLGRRVNLQVQGHGAASSQTYISSCLFQESGHGNGTASLLLLVDVGVRV
ncbi:hypothetical protein EXIGLDRAFT_165229 [Exidia glandulosa HHB12029]|uniref:Uncharacterized protein n=1 Tax=Exidia glandulosa HHB12029 TaxID=1314781 RepID=A0A165FD08_EXIGL|nr:hypothetical protein EXIGLDRAFT_165229 [Exidia glandulosa HHB12029]